MDHSRTTRKKKNQKKFYSKKISELFHCLRINPSNKFNGPRIFKKSKNWLNSYLLCVKQYFLLYSTSFYFCSLERFLLCSRWYWRLFSCSSSTEFWYLSQTCFHLLSFSFSDSFDFLYCTSFRSFSLCFW